MICWVYYMYNKEWMVLSKWWTKSKKETRDTGVEVSCPLNKDFEGLDFLKEDYFIIEQIKEKEVLWNGLA